MSEKTATEPAEGEGISTVNEVRKPATRPKAFLGLALACVLLVGLASVLLSRYQTQRKHEAKEKDAAALVATASTAGAQPLKVTGNAAGVPPTAGGVAPSVAPQDPRARINQTSPTLVVPAIEPDATDAPPIGVHATRSGSLGASAGIASGTTSNGARGVPAPPPMDPLDAPILLAPAPAIAPSARGAGMVGGQSPASADVVVTDAMNQT
ncbi:MAG TPA: hypothetical protein VEE84_02995, partial [Burkholderiaceae bacterium]|nr:hypothetical protein [Burkholderiaceae bacterium]